MSQKPKNKWDGPLLITGAVASIFALSTCANNDAMPDLSDIDAPEAVENAVEELLEKLDYNPDDNL